MRTFMFVAVALAAGSAAAAGVTVSFTNKPDATWTRLRDGAVSAPRDAATGQASGKRTVSTLVLEAPGSSAQASLAGIAEKASVANAGYTASTSVSSGASTKRTPWFWQLSWPASAETTRAVSSWFLAPTPKEMTVQFADGRSLVLANCTPTAWVPLSMPAAGPSTQVALSCQSLKKPADKANPGWRLVEAAGAAKGETVVVSAGSASITWSACAFGSWNMGSEAGPPVQPVEALNLTCGTAAPTGPSKVAPANKVPAARAPLLR